MRQRLVPPGTYYSFFNKELIEGRRSTHTSSVGLCDCCRKKKDLISSKAQQKLMMLNRSTKRMTVICKKVLAVAEVITLFWGYFYTLTQCLMVASDKKKSTFLQEINIVHTLKVTSLLCLWSFNTNRPCLWFNLSILPTTSNICLPLSSSPAFHHVYKGT